MQINIQILLITSLITAIIGGVIGAIISALIGEPLKRLVNGDIKKQKDLQSIRNNRDIAINYIREINKTPTTENFCQDLFNNKKNCLSIEQTYNLLCEIEKEGIIKGIRFDQTTMATTSWRCIKY